MTDVQLTENEKRIVKNILKTHYKNAEVFAFGSRVNGNAKPYSDLDLVVKSNGVFELADIANLKEAFANSDLVFKVDICDWYSLDNAFKKSIENELVLI